MKTDIQIAQETTMLPITQVAAAYGIGEDDLELYGKYKAKLSNEFRKSIEDKPSGKLVLVTAINPTPAGEGKTTTSIGLAQALSKAGKKTLVALREPSLGPCFGIKGGAAGGGYSQVVPMEDLNLHFTGDFHAITTANNLLAALLDNHIQQGNALGIDTRQVLWKRCLDMNDRALRNIVIGLGAKADGVVREDHFVITVASEIMAILCLATDLTDLKERLGRIIVAYNFAGEPVTAKDLNAVGAMAALLKDAMKPNLIQTLEHTGALVHGGPFANIAHGCNSVIATKTALKLSEITVTEAGDYKFCVRFGDEFLNYDYVTLLVEEYYVGIEGASSVVSLVKEDDPTSKNFTFTGAVKYFIDVEVKVIEGNDCSVSNVEDVMVSSVDGSVVTVLANSGVESVLYFCVLLGSDYYHVDTPLEVKELTTVTVNDMVNTLKLTEGTYAAIDAALARTRELAQG